MTRMISSPTTGPFNPNPLPISKGGTGAKTGPQAVINLGGVAVSSIGQPLGPALLKAGTGKLPNASFGGMFSGTSIDGALNIAVSGTGTYVITDFDFTATYIVTATSGSVSRVGNIITYSAPNAVGAAGFTINGKPVTIQVITPKPDAPVILSPVNAATNQLGTVAVSSSAFAMYLGAGADTHASTDWQLATDAGFTTVVQSSTADAVNKTSWVVSGLSVSTTYYVRARYNGTTSGAGSWGSANSFTTNAGWPATQQAKLLVSDPGAYDRFGVSIVLSGDGNTCVAGAYNKNGTYSGQGAVYIFTRSGSTWTQQWKLVASDPAANDFFGHCVALSGDGNTCAVGVHTRTNYQGAAYIFTRSGVTWTQQAKLLASDPASYDYFGYFVSLSGDGETCAVGAYNKTGTYSGQGAVYIFTRSGVTWTQQTKLLAGDPGADDWFGYSVSLSGDGNTCAVGAYNKTGATGAFQGFAYVFIREVVWWGITWTQQAKLLASDPAASDYFGYFVSLSGDGETCAVGAYSKTGAAGINQGAVYIFTRSGVTWTQQTKLLAGDPAANDAFGISVALSSDGETCAVGAYNKTGTYSGQGAVYIFTRSGVTWTQQTKLLAGDPAADDSFGYSIAISDDGNTCAVGAYGKTGSAGTNQGAAYIFV